MTASASVFVVYRDVMLPISVSMSSAVALAQIVRPDLEAQAEMATLLPGLLDRPNASSIWFLFIWRIDRGTGGSDPFARPIQERRDPSATIRRMQSPAADIPGHIQLRSSQNTFRTSVPSIAQPPGDQPDLVRERDLQRVENVAGVAAISATASFVRKTGGGDEYARRGARHYAHPARR